MCLQRTGISVSLIDNLPHDAVVAQPLTRSVRQSLKGTMIIIHEYDANWPVLFEEEAHRLLTAFGSAAQLKEVLARREHLPKRVELAESRRPKNRRLKARVL